MISVAGGVCGVALGCVLGMVALLFMDTDAASRAKRAGSRHKVATEMLQHAQGLFSSANLTLYIIDGNMLCPYAGTARLQEDSLPLIGDSLPARAVATASVVRPLTEAEGSLSFFGLSPKQSDPSTHPGLAIPLRHADSGHITGVLYAKGREANQPYDEAEERALMMLAHHLALHMDEKLVA
jgi:GAF domain-containing protein